MITREFGQTNQIYTDIKYTNTDTHTHLFYLLRNLFLFQRARSKLQKWILFLYIERKKILPKKGKVLAFMVSAAIAHGPRNTEIIKKIC